MHIVQNWFEFFFSINKSKKQMDRERMDIAERCFTRVHHIAINIMRCTEEKKTNRRNGGSRLSTDVANSYTFYSIRNGTYGKASAAYHQSSVVSRNKESLEWSHSVQLCMLFQYVLQTLLIMNETISLEMHLARNLMTKNTL